jgi:endonuclease YncB( thermonuclease family)
VKPADICVVDGDTIEALGKRIRLVGFDAPELGGHARCGLERTLAARATSRLRQMIRTGLPDGGRAGRRRPTDR